FGKRAGAGPEASPDHCVDRPYDRLARPGGARPTRVAAAGHERKESPDGETRRGSSRPRTDLHRALEATPARDRRDLSGATVPGERDGRGGRDARRRLLRDPRRAGEGRSAWAHDRDAV